MGRKNNLQKKLSTICRNLKEAWIRETPPAPDIERHTAIYGILTRNKTDVRVHQSTSADVCTVPDTVPQTARTVEHLIAQDIDRSFGGRSGHACLGHIEGNPLVDDMRQEFFYLPTQRTAMIARATELESLFGDVYIGQCLFQRIEEFGHRGRSVYAVARDYAHALPHNEIWKDDVTDPHTVATRLIETSPGNYQALITLDRDCTPSERKRLMTAWRGDDGDTCSSDAVHFRRLAGGRNTKPDAENWRVRVAADTGRTYSADKLLARCEPERESTHTPDCFSSADWQELPNGESLWTSPRWRALATRQRPQLKTLLIDREPIPLANKRSGQTNDDSRSNQRAVFVKNVLEAYDPPPLEELRAVALYFREYLGERKTDREFQTDIDRLIYIYLDQLYTRREKVYSPKSTKYIPGQHTPGVIKPKAPRGRAGSHADLVENVYSLLLDSGDGHTAQVKIGQLAATIGVDRRTISNILVELRDAGRIEKPRQVGQHGGLHITLSGMIYSAEAITEFSTATPETDETAIHAIESTCTKQQDPGVCVLSVAETDPSSEPTEPPPSLQAAPAVEHAPDPELLIYVYALACEADQPRDYTGYTADQLVSEAARLAGVLDQNIAPSATDAPAEAVYVPGYDWTNGGVLDLTRWRDPRVRRARRAGRRARA